MSAGLDVIAGAGVDTAWSRDPVSPALGEDVARARLLATLSAHGGFGGASSESSVTWSLAIRGWLEARGKAPASGGVLDRGTYLYEATPMAAYVDVPIGSWLRARVGEQIVAFGRTDLFSAADILGRRDLRLAPGIDRDGGRIPSPILRIDAAPASWFDATLAWSVISDPHRIDLLGTSWSFVGPGLLGLAGTSRGTFERVARATDAATFLRVMEAYAQASSSSPALLAGELGDLAAHVALHGKGFDVSLTYGWVRSKLPFISVDPALRAVAQNGDLPSALQLVSALDAGRPLLTTRYPRMHQFALDFEGNAGPFTLAWELGWSPSRPLYQLDDDGYPQEADRALLSAAARAQYVANERFSLVAEVLGVAAAGPSDTGETNHPLVVLGSRRATLGAMLTAHWEPFRRHAFDVAAVATSSGPSLAITPRWSWEVAEHWTLGAFGAAFPDLRAPKARLAVTLADLVVGRDFVELFARFRM